MQGARPGWGVDQPAPHAPPPPPRGEEKKKKGGPQGGGGGGGGGEISKMHGKREKLGNLRNNAQYLPAAKGMRCSHVNREGAANARYGGDCLAPPYPSFLSCRILIKSLLIST